MRKLNLTRCKICNKDCNPRGFSQHAQKSHGLSIKEYIIQFELDGSPPVCNCGCGREVTIRGYQVMDYIDGHSPSGRFSTGVSPKRDHNKWKTNLTKGIRNFVEKMKSEDPSFRRGANNNFFGRHHSEETKSSIKKKIEDQIESGRHPFLGNANGRIGRSALEDEFEEYLRENSIQYERSHRLSYVPEGRRSVRYKYYDFYIPEVNLLIEINGTFWHPKEYSEKLTKIQVNNLENDKLKLNLAMSCGYDLLSVYDTELGDFMSNNILKGMISSRKDVKLEVEYNPVG